MSDFQTTTERQFKPPESNDTQIGQGELSQIDVPEDKLQELASWVGAELLKAQDNRATFEQNLLNWQKIYEAQSDPSKANWPWKGAASITVPVAATHADTVLSRLMNTLFGVRQLWSGKPRSSKWVDVVNPIETWLNWLATETLGMYRVCQDWFMQCIKYGTGVLKLPWVKLQRQVKYKDGQGQVVEDTLLKHDGPLPVVVPLMDFFVSQDAFTVKDIQVCEWVAHRCVLTKKQLKEREASGIYIKGSVDKILSFTRSQPTLTEDEANRLVGIDLSQLNDYEVYEVWASYDLEGKGQLSELLMDFNLDTNTLLRAVYNPYRHQERPFHLIRYMPRDDHLLGIGVCQMLQDVQTEVSTIHRMRLDNAAIANTKLWKKKRLAQISDVNIYPGGLLEVDEMDDIMPMDMGAEHTTLLQEELHTNSIGEKRTGISDYTVGRESAAIGSRATATSTLALIREGNKRFLLTINDIRKALTDIAHQVIMMYQQFLTGQKVMFEIFSDKEKQIVEQFFQMPAEYSRANVIIDTPALSDQDNKEVTKQSLISLAQLMQQFYASLFQAFGMALSPQAPPQMKQLAAQGASSATKMWKRLLEAFDFRDPETFAPDVDSMLQLASGLEQMNGGQNQQPTGPGGVGAATGQPGMGAIGPRNPAAKYSGDIFNVPGTYGVPEGSLGQSLGYGQ